MVAFEVYAVGKTVADLTGLKLVDGSLDDSEDLKSSVTMTVDEYISVTKKASDSAVNLK